MMMEYPYFTPNYDALPPKDCIFDRQLSPDLAGYGILKRIAGLGKAKSACLSVLYHLDAVLYMTRFDGTGWRQGEQISRFRQADRVWTTAYLEGGREITPLRIKIQYVILYVNGQHRKGGESLGEADG